MTSIQANVVPEYHHWTKALFRKRLVNHQVSFSIEDEYLINPKMLMLYNFSDAPLFNKYKSAIFDLRRGWVLTRSSSKQLIDYFSRNCLIGGVRLQKKLDEDFGHKHHHMLSFGQTAFFSLRGYTRYATDWVSMHHMADYCFKNGQIVFSSVTINKQKYEFGFAGNKFLRKSLAQAIVHNTHIYRLTYHYMKRCRGWNIGDPNLESFLFLNLDLSENNDLHVGIRKLSHLIIEEYVQYYLKRVSQEVSHEVKVAILKGILSYHPFFCKLTSRFWNVH